MDGWMNQKHQATSKEEKYMLVDRAYNTANPGSQSFFSGIQMLVLLQKYRSFGTNLKNNCL
jgi:hypothetical protein